MQQCRSLEHTDNPQTNNFASTVETEFQSAWRG